nr:hypothetical protein CFP56_21888 [Quercus suber]
MQSKNINWIKGSTSTNFQTTSSESCRTSPPGMPINPTTSSLPTNMSSLTRAPSTWHDTTQPQIQSWSPRRKLRQFETELGISNTAPIAPMRTDASGEEETIHRCDDSGTNPSGFDAISRASSYPNANVSLDQQAAYFQHIKSNKRSAQPNDPPARKKKIRSLNDGPEVSDPADVRPTCLTTLKLAAGKLSRFAAEQTSASFDAVPDIPVNAQLSGEISRGVSGSPVQPSFVRLESVDPKQEQMETVSERDTRQVAAVGTLGSVEATSGGWRQLQATCVEDHVLRDLCIHVRQVGSFTCHIWLHLAAYPNRDTLFAKLEIVKARFPHLGEHEISSITVMSMGMDCDYSIDIEKDGVAGAKAFDCLLSWSRSQGADIGQDFTAGLNVD